MAEISFSAYYKAARRVLSERCDPTNCTTEQRLRTIVDDLDLVRAWAAKQDSITSVSYERATVDIAQEAHKWWQLHQESFSADTAYQKLVKPPPIEDLISAEKKG